MATNRYAVTYKSGLMNRTIVDADDPVTAAKMGLVEYRRNSGDVESVSFLPLEKVVDEVVLLVD